MIRFPGVARADHPGHGRHHRGGAFRFDVLAWQKRYELFPRPRGSARVVFRTARARRQAVAEYANRDRRQVNTTEIKQRLVWQPRDNIPTEQPPAFPH